MGRLVVVVLLLGAVVLLLRPLGDGSPSGWPIRMPALIDGGGTVTVLALGLDRRGTEPARADVILLVRIGPPGQPPAVLSIPRDLWVDIPEQGEDRINSAYIWGELNTGDGTALTQRTIEENFGVQVDRVAVFDFACFEHVVDAAGGVTVDVARQIVDQTYPTEEGGTTALVFEPGPQTLSGERALQYVRTRSADTDFGRIRRQHQVITALVEGLRNPVTSLRVGFTMMTRCPSAGTELSLADVGLLGAVVATSGDPRFELLDESAVSPTVTPTGAQVLLPHWDQIRPLVAELFGARGPR